MTNALVLRPHPFTMDAGMFPVRSGQTLQAMLDEAAQGAEIAATLRVEIGGYEVPRALWAKVKPKAGTAIHATVMPAGGSGGKILRTVLLVAVAAVATWLTMGGASSMFASGSFWATTAGSATLGAAASLIGHRAGGTLTPAGAA